MARGENRLGVPPPRKMLPTSRPATRVRLRLEIALQRGDVALLLELPVQGVRVEIAVRALADAPGKVHVERERWNFEHGDIAIGRCVVHLGFRPAHAHD